MSTRPAAPHAPIPTRYDKTARSSVAAVALASLELLDEPAVTLLGGRVRHDGVPGLPSHAPGPAGAGVPTVSGHPLRAPRKGHLAVPAGLTDCGACSWETQAGRARTVPGTGSGKRGTHSDAEMAEARTGTRQ
ncbi:hypothetical protein GCM10010327_60150 [Streptomyces nitrosporeus]|nr:hypothetical protein GCM10010327_60150 [Streptomyces nitrosporeus]